MFVRERSCVSYRESFDISTVNYPSRVAVSRKLFFYWRRKEIRVWLSRLHRFSSSHTLLHTCIIINRLFQQNHLYDKPYNANLENESISIYHHAYIQQNHRLLRLTPDPHFVWRQSPSCSCEIDTRAILFKYICISASHHAATAWH